MGHLRTLSIDIAALVVTGLKVEDGKIQPNRVRFPLVCISGSYVASFIVTAMQAYKKDKSEGEDPASKKEHCLFVLWYRFCTRDRGQCCSRVYPVVAPPLSPAMTAKALALVVFVLLITIVGIALPLVVMMNSTKVYVDTRLVRSIAQGLIYAHMIDCSERSGDVLLQRECLLNVQPY